MSDRLYLVTDYETRSRADLKKCGAYEYAKHPSTEIMCVAWRLGTKAELREQLKTKTPAKTWSPFFPSPFGEFVNALLNPQVIKTAQNAFFEQVITRFVLARVMRSKPALAEIPSSEWLCTASLARAMSYPGKLEETGPAMRLPVKKDAEGHRVMLQVSKPRKPRKGEDPNGVYWFDDEDRIKRLIQYCATDVDVETLILLNLPELKSSERETWELDQRINFRGFRVDRALAKTALALIPVVTKDLDAETKRLTGGKVETTRKVAAVLSYLKRKGVTLPNLQEKTVEDALSAGLATGTAKRLLEIRLLNSKTSTAKYVQFLARSTSDGRVRDSLVYHGAATGRWAGAGLQPHNFPRGSIRNTPLAAEIVSEGDLELIKLIYGDPMKVFSSVLRSVIRASQGKLLYCGDFAGIEVRVLFWLAGHSLGLKAYRDGDDLYIELAAVIFGVPIEKVTKDQREIGKRAILGCGFGMGAPKFLDTCIQFGAEIDADLAEKAVKSYRSKHKPVKTLWDNVHRAAVSAVENPGKRYATNKTKWFMEGRYLYCELPSGRRLAYVEPRIEYKPTPWGDRRPELSHMGWNQKIKKWVREKTYGGKLTENVVQATARDLMRDAMFRSEDRGYEVLLTVHDEILSEKAGGSVEEFETLMAKTEPWATGLPVKVEAWSGKRYRK